MKKLNKIVTVIALFLVINVGTNAQESIIQTEIKGTVYESATGKVLAGAKVSIEGLTSSITDENGKFTINKTYKGAYLTIVAPGYITKQIPVVAKSEFQIWMMDESYKLKSTSVKNVFDSKNNYAVNNSLASHENSEDCRTGYASVEDVLKTGFSGLNVISRSGMPGAGSNLFMNGINSLNTNNQPLIVVDGVIFDNQTMFSLIGGNNTSALSDIDVKDIDNITVLKDGTSIYGSKGANGVLLITTLRAKDAATRINFYSYMGINTQPSSTYPMMNGWSHKNYLTDILSSAGYTSNQIQDLPYINNTKPVLENWGISGNADYYNYNQETNWQDEVFKTSFNRNYHINVTGGNDATLYAISVGYLGHDGLVENTSFSRYSSRVNASIKMSEWFKMIANVSFVYTDRQLSYEGLNKNFNPVYASLVKSPFTSPYIYNYEGLKTPNLSDKDAFNFSNPRAIIENSNPGSNRFRFFSSVNGIITFSKNVFADVIVGITSDRVTKESIFLPESGIYHPVQANGEITNQTQQMRNMFKQLNSDVRLTYKKTFNNVHDFAARAGVRILTSSNELDWGKAYNTSSDEMKTLGDGKNTLAEMGGSLGEWNSISNYASVDYSYANRYFVTVNAALDGSSRFGKNADGIKIGNNVFGLFPSINGAWIISSEDFMSQQSMFDVLKLRASYSVSGNDDIGNYSSSKYYISNGFLGAYGLIRGNIPDEKLKWETNRKLNAGIDISMLKERLNLSIDVYKSTTSDLISITNLPTVSGLSTSISNDGTLQNTGFDLSLSGRIINTKNFKWDAGLTVSAYKNKLTERTIDEQLSSLAGAVIRTKVGAPIAQFYGYKTDGIYNSAQEASSEPLAIKNPYGVTVPFTAGDMKFVDLKTDGYIDENDMTVIGDPNPDFFGSISNTLRYKRFSLNAICSFVVGNDVYNALRANLESFSGFENQTIAANSRWRYDGQQTNTPKATYGDPMGNARFSDRWIEDGSYLRLKTVTLGYDIPVKTGFISNLNVYVTANNLLTLTGYKGYDPEFSSGQSPINAGIDMGATPQPRSILVGLKLGL